MNLTNPIAVPVDSEAADDEQKMDDGVRFVELGIV